MRVVLGADELGSDAQLTGQPLDTSLQYVVYAELVADLPRVDRLVAVGESGIARDHKHIVDPRQIGRYILGDPIGKILLLGVIAEIGKWQHDDRQTRRDKRLRYRASG